MKIFHLVLIACLSFASFSALAQNIGAQSDKDIELTRSKFDHSYLLNLPPNFGGRDRQHTLLFKTSLLPQSLGEGIK
jgi:hypothetical protein